MSVPDFNHSIKLKVLYHVQGAHITPQDNINERQRKELETFTACSIFTDNIRHPLVLGQWVTNIVRKNTTPHSKARQGGGQITREIATP